jgi:hypothetical protein
MATFICSGEQHWALQARCRCDRLLRNGHFKSPPSDLVLSIPIVVMKCRAEDCGGKRCQVHLLFSSVSARDCLRLSLKPCFVACTAATERGRVGHCQGVFMQCETVARSNRKYLCTTVAVRLKKTLLARSMRLAIPREICVF